MSAAKKLPRTKLAEPYHKIAAIDGRHPFATAVPGGHVAYQVRHRPHGKVLYFNFALAKEMGLIDKDHPEQLNKDLEKTLLDTFAIQIINEYDIINKTKINPADIKPNRYMATRYLQLQHPNKSGLTSGDGRSIWNGYHSHRGTTWDISSCGTGATCLSPATAINKRFYRTGDPTISYGCGYSEVSEGISNAIFSEIFHLNGVATERTLLVLEFPKGLAITVRANKNLLRPSHIFNHLKQENLPRLKSAVDYYISRQISNGELIPDKRFPNIYQQFLAEITSTFAKITARFESDYIFCWLDWDGDNILANGGIIDYGSIRQFGLFHHEYRFDDVERWSTTITEQKLKARNTVQNFAQICNFIITGKKKPLAKFRHHSALKEFDRIFTHEKSRLLLMKIGFTESQADQLQKSAKSSLRTFEQAFSYFERMTSIKGPVKLEDGISRNAIFCMRDALRELPKHFATSNKFLSGEEFIDMIASSYATKKDLRLTPGRRLRVYRLQQSYMNLVQHAAKIEHCSNDKIIQSIIKRSSIINRYERITGDAVVYIAEKLSQKRRKITQNDMQKIIVQFIESQVLAPDFNKKIMRDVSRDQSAVNRILTDIQKLVREFREGL